MGVLSEVCRAGESRQQAGAPAQHVVLLSVAKSRSVCNMIDICCCWGLLN